jgi:hypothetical protein
MGGHFLIEENDDENSSRGQRKGGGDKIEQLPIFLLGQAQFLA